MKEKTKGLLIDTAIYVTGFSAATVPFALTDPIYTAVALFTFTATLWIFIFSTVLSDVSVYDPYWSVAPVVILAAVMIKYRIWTVNA